MYSKRCLHCQSSLCNLNHSLHILYLLIYIWSLSPLFNSPESVFRLKAICMFYLIQLSESYKLFSFGQITFNN
jgi:hypothetical protein